MKIMLEKRWEAHEWYTKVKLRISFHFHFPTNGLIEIHTGAIVLKYWLFCGTVSHLLGGCRHHHIHAHVALQLPGLLQVLRHRCLCIEKMTKEKFYWTQGFCYLHHHWYHFCIYQFHKKFQTGLTALRACHWPKEWRPTLNLRGWEEACWGWIS